MINAIAINVVISGGFIAMLLTLFAVVFLALGGLIGMLRGWKKATSHFILAFISSIISFVITLPIAKVIANIVSPLIRSEMGETYEQLNAEMPTLAKTIDALPAALLAPVLFVVFFFIISLILSLFSPLVTKLFGTEGKKPQTEATSCEDNPDAAPRADSKIEEKKPNAHSNEKAQKQKKVSNEKKPGKGVDRLIGALVGVVHALLIFVILWMPLTGYTELAAQAVEATDEIEISNDEKTQNTIKAVKAYYDCYGEPVNNGFVFKMTSALGGKATFKALTAMKIDGSRYVLADEVGSLVNLAVTAAPFMSESPENYGEKQVKAVDSLIMLLDNDVMLKDILAEGLSSASNSWLNNKTFMGIAKPNIKGSTVKILDELLGVFKTTTSQTVIADIKVFSDIFKVMVENKVFTMLGKEKTDIKNLLAQDGFISGLIEAAYGNERMQPVLDSIINTGIALVGEQLGIPENNEEIYDNLINSIADSVTESLNAGNTEESQKSLENKISTAFKDNGIEVSDELIPFISKYIVKAFEGKDNVTKEDVIAFFKSTTEELTKNGVTYSGSGNNSTKEPVIADVTPKISNNVRLMLDEISKSAPDASQALSKIAGDIKSGNIDSKSMTIEKLQNSISSVSKEKLSEESKRLENIVKSSVKIMENMNGKTGTDVITSLDVDALKDMIKDLQKSEILGDSSNSLIQAVLESKQMKDSGIDGSELFEDITEAGGLDTVADTVGVVQETVKLVDILKASNGKITDPSQKKELEENIKYLVENMSDSTAKLITKQITPDKLAKYGVKDPKQADAVSTIITNVLSTMSEKKSLNSEEYKKETDAILHLYDVATTLSGTTKTLSDLKSDLDDIVKTVLESEIICESIVKTAFDGNTPKSNPLMLTSKMGDNDIKLIVDSLNRYSDSNYSKVSDKSKFNKELEAIAIIFNVDVTVSNGHVTVNK